MKPWKDETDHGILFKVNVTRTITFNIESNGYCPVTLSELAMSIKGEYSAKYL